MSPTRVVPRALAGLAALTLSFGGAVGALVLTAGPAAADTIPVTNTADDGTATSLRSVLESVNDGDVVVLNAGATYQLTICEEPAPPAPAALESSPGWADVEISGAVTIVGNGATIEQTCPDRVLYTQDEIALQGVTITGGSVEGPGGGLFMDSDSPITLGDVTFAGNESLDGGGIATFGDVSMTGSTFTDNHVLGNGDGGGLKVFSDVAVVTIDGSTFSGNSADGWGGAFEQESGDIGGGATGVFELTVTNSAIVGNTANSDGAGGLDTEDDATITIDHSTVSGNSGGLAGGVGSFTENTTFSANGSTFSGNTSSSAGSAVLGSGTYTFVNSTITGNTEGAFGAVTVDGALSLVHVTMTNNTSLGELEPDALSSRGLGALAEDDDAANIVTDSLTSADSVVAQPLGAVNCAAGEPQMAAAAVSSTDGGYNFSDDTSCGFVAPTSSQTTPNDPVLGALANNGGPTQTLLPLAGSPLLDAIPTAVCGANVDQRGVTRPQGTGCDIGAVEVEALTPAPAALVTPRFTG